ncbi:hypothetical protein BLNAU_6304 [Blattamonas nauphoetae]|uniref:Uncharacterized protein n=1 Tax=Blattamonas nauphoetae TaxID=2049346 RepID=A0ABQ9Y4Z0_9EUKA|nr:hypothetical protein BLNAU_6304 [Blattamonas nauphoetae]
MTTNHLNRAYLEQKRLTLSKASQDYNPDYRTANFDSVGYVPAKWSMPKEKRMPWPKTNCKGNYTPNYRSVEGHVPGSSWSKQTSRSKVPPPQYPDVTYDASLSQVKRRTPTVNMKSGTSRTQNKAPSYADATYNLHYSQVDPQVKHTPSIAKQTGRDRAVMPGTHRQAVYNPSPVKPTYNVSSWSNISNPRASDVKNLSSELDFLIQQAEKQWKHVDETLAEFTDAVPAFYCSSTACYSITPLSMVSLIVSLFSTLFAQCGCSQGCFSSPYMTQQCQPSCYAPPPPAPCYQQQQPCALPQAPSPCALPQQPSPCALPPQRRYGSNDLYRFHNDGSNRAGTADHMRANSDYDQARSSAAETCNANRARANLDADVRSSNHAFCETNENEFLVHQKRNRVDTGDSCAQTAKLNMDAENACQAAQKCSERDTARMNQGRDATTCCEQTYANDACGTSAQCAFR